MASSENPRTTRGTAHRSKIVGVIVLALASMGVLAALLFLPVSHLQVNFASLQPMKGPAINANNTAQIRFVTSTNKHPHAPRNKGSLDWPEGDCTYWANYRYHELSGYWVSWPGNPDQWVMGARNAGWSVSTQPHLHAIIVLMPSVQNAGQNGAVGVVENVTHNGKLSAVDASLMNWTADGGDWNRASDYTFNVGAGIYFIWHP